MDDQDDQRERELWVLRITAASPNWRERFEVKDENKDGLEPVLVEVGDYVYERYGDDDNYVEIRLDYIVVRDLKLVAFTPSEREDEDVFELTRPRDTMTRTEGSPPTPIQPRERSL